MTLLLDRDKSDLLDNFLSGRADCVIEELFREATRFAVRVIKSRPPITVRMVLNRLRRWDDAIDSHDFNSAGLRVSHADVANAVFVLANFGRNLFVARHLLRAARIIAF